MADVYHQHTADTAAKHEARISLSTFNIVYIVKFYIIMYKIFGVRQLCV